jgi:catechol 2,3-dioxygenase-like lactoylglutathione lyase family enzyme
MPVTSLDHATVLTTDTARTSAFYAEIFDMHPGPRPNFDFPGAWLYAGGTPVLHIVERTEIPASGGPIEHVAFRGTGRAACVAALEAKGLPFRIIKLAGGGPEQGEAWQLFVADPNGALVEVLFKEPPAAA